ncbi:hypothetical protein HUJ04_001353 [Dendroctonus ponderosae]|nr:hypothetical protein HUJ04_001353 [Dendroctonus ponderosae]
MSEEQTPDPGGTSITPQELSNASDQHQFVHTAQLKEMLRNEQSNISQEKVDDYLKTLNKARAKRSKIRSGETSGSSSNITISSANIDANKKERVNLLRQQLEENKARLAQRGKSQKGIEEMVIQLQAQLNDSQTLVSSTPLNISLVETKNLDYNENTPQKELYNILLTKERKIADLLSKSEKLEGSVLDLQENLKEKDSVIDARTKAVTLMTESLSKKGKTTLDALEETKDEMRLMQESFVNLEADMQARQSLLLNDLKAKNQQIYELNEINDKLTRNLREKQKSIRGAPFRVTTAEGLEVEVTRRELALREAMILHDVTAGEPEGEDFEKRFSEICEKDANLKIAELEMQLKGALLRLEEKEARIISTQNGADLLRENRILHQEISDLYAKIEELEGTVVQLQKFEHQYIEAAEAMNRTTQENENLLSSHSNNLEKIGALEKQLADALTELKLLKNTGMSKSVKSDKDDGEITKLKKQLEESNKNMIKMRAVQKGKIKELNKKLDQFKKMNDSNVLITQLQNEIVNLNEKIAELEDEKGNLQLKMVDSSTNSKDDFTESEEEIKQLKEKLNKTEQEIDEKDKVIEILEAEVISLKSDLQIKSEQEVKVSNQVSSEVSSICYEEQIEKLESEKKDLLQQINNLNADKENLLLELELVKKEKQEISAKLDLYIQENIDLIDKLEKLSAEKVSSVESIEIVEGLTHQEKLELAAYQKHINPEESLKCTEDDVLEPPVELNESVLQLSEDTVELLQKIEMFTQERKEVMQKMESLKEENNSLNIKIKEIENNRDILEETYEQVQNEKDILHNEKEQLAEKLLKLQRKDEEVKPAEASTIVLDTELKELQIKCESLIQENDKLKCKLKDFDSIIQEKYDIEHRLRDVLENNTSLDTKLNSNLDEINTYQLTIEENKTELISSAGIINKLQKQLEEREQDIQELHMNISELNSVISELQSKESHFAEMESELSDLKSTLMTQITQAGDYESEISQSNEIIRNLNDELVAANRRYLELENEIALKQHEIEKLTKDVINKDSLIVRLQEDIEKKDQSFKVVSEDMKGKYLQLKGQLDDNDDSLHQQITELSNKNKDQLGKMKKIAANLKKKSVLYQELEDRYKADEEKWKTEQTQAKTHIEILEEKVTSLTHALAASESNLEYNLQQIELLQNELLSLREKFEILEQTNADQQHYIQNLKRKQEKLSETSLQQEMSDSLHEEVNSSFAKHVPDDKIRELELLMETNELQLNDYKEKVDRLQEDLRNHQDANAHLEAINAELVEKLKLTSNSFKEKALLQDQLELRLAEISANDETLSKRLQETQVEHSEILKKCADYEELIKKMKIKLKKAHDKVTELKAMYGTVQDLEATNTSLRNQITTLEETQRHLQNENESLQKRILSDYEKIETDYQLQLQELLKIKNELTIDNEKLVDSVKDLEERELQLTSELVDHKNRIDEIEKTKSDEIKLLLQDLNYAKFKNAELASERDDANLKLQVSVTQIVELGQELSTAQNQLLNYESQQKYIQELTMDRDEQIEALNRFNDLHQQFIAESSELKRALQNSENEILKVTQQKAQLDKENEQLKQEILSLEFEKSCLEASCQSSQKPFEPPVTEALNSPAASLQLTETKILADSEKSVFELEILRQQLNNSEQELQNAVEEINVLKKRLCEKSSEKFVKKSLQKEQENSVSREIDNKVNQIPLFNAFAEQSVASSSVFDSFGATGQVETNWGREVNQSLQVADDSQATVSITDSHSEQSQQEHPSFPPVVEDGRAALLQKIKALEFLLYNVDKEKEIAQDQWTAMLNELTKLIYKKSAPSEAALESEILSQSTVDNLSNINKRDLQSIEFTPINTNFGEQATPVAEELVEPKSAYMCFGGGELHKEDAKKIESLESQILPEQDVAEAALNKKELQKLEYEIVEHSLGEQRQPVIEPLVKPKHAYLCYSKDDKPQSLEAFEENDDGWGWGPEEARLEEEHMSTVENTPQVKSLLLEIQQLKENIMVLQIERENHLEEIKQLQIKSGKLIKKCKELKSKTEQSVSSKKQDDTSFFDLNETIQEELKAQVQQLEKKLKELTVDQEKDKVEKNNLLKRVDVLTSANERMLEMKEIQDSEVFRLRRNYDEIAQKLQENEWGSDGFGESQKPLTSLVMTTDMSADADQITKIKQLEDTIKDLSLDNEELQTLLEEQNSKRLEAEKLKNTDNEPELVELRNINENLHRELSETKTRIAELQAELNRLEIEKSDFKGKICNLEDTLRQQDVTIQELKVFNSQSQGIDLDETEVFDMKNQTSGHQEKLRAQEDIIDEFQSKLHDVTNAKFALDLIVHQLQQDSMAKVEENLQLLSSLKEKQLQTEELRLQVENLNVSTNAQESVINNLSVSVEQLRRDKTVLEGHITELNNKLQYNEEELLRLAADNQQKELNYQTVEQELQSKIMENQQYESVIDELKTRVLEREAFAIQNNKLDEETQNLSEQLRVKTLELEEEEHSIKEWQLQLDENKAGELSEINNKIRQTEELFTEKLNKDAEVIQRLSTELENKEHEFQERMDTFISELNENWKVQSDQRACEVEETYKRHLEAMDKEYISVQEKMKLDIVELQEKCNLLVNENNELRKNVDQEIRNEVDNKSAMQHQISNLQKTINLLNEKVVEKDKQIEELQNYLSNYTLLENELHVLRRENAEKETKLASINVIIETTQKQFDEKREVIEEIVSILEKQALTPISYEKQDVLCELQRQLQQATGRDGEIKTLNEAIRELESNLARSSGEKAREITGLNQVIEDLERELSVIHEKEAEIVRLSTELKLVLEEKDKLTYEIALNKREKEALNNDLAQLKTEHSQCLITIEALKQSIEASANTHQVLQKTLDERCKEIHDLNESVFELQQGARNDSNEEVESMYSDLSKMKEEYLTLQGYLSEWRTKLTDSNQQLAQKIQELQVANEKIIHYQQSYEECDEKNKQLKKLMDQQEIEYNNSLAMLKNSVASDVQDHYNELVSNRDLDIDTLKGQIQELIAANQSYAERLNQEISAKEQMQQQLFENNQLVDEDTKQLEELKLIIEDQVAKIEQLKKELFDKSNQYDSLIAEMDVGRLPITRQPLSAAPTAPVADTKRQYEDDDLSAPASRAELDVALYMLHQRDVRCEELTVELTQLLEERDILQLRLSNAIREKEELKSRPGPVGGCLRLAHFAHDGSNDAENLSLFLYHVVDLFGCKECTDTLLRTTIGLAWGILNQKANIVYLPGKVMEDLLGFARIPFTTWDGDNVSGHKPGSLEMSKGPTISGTLSELILFYAARLRRIPSDHLPLVYCSMKVTDHYDYPQYCLEDL